jgi:catechol-2,3-dioxygenase
MPDLRRLAMKAENPNSRAEFYQDVFELDNIGEDGGAVFLSDGSFNLAFLPLRGSMSRGLARMERPESNPFENDWRKPWTAAENLVECGGKAGIDYEMRDPDGNAIGLCKRAFEVAYDKRLVPLRHIAFYTPDPQRLGEFCCKILGMKEVARTDRLSIFVSDGYFYLALLYKRTEEPLGLNHFGFHVASNEEMRARAEKAGSHAARDDLNEFRSPNIACTIPKGME